MVLNFDLEEGNVIYESLIEFNQDASLKLTFDSSRPHVVKLSNVITFHGLTNSHDHLEFNLFPFLGNRIYDDYQSWGYDIHKENKNEINRVLAIPIDLRIKWGILKNLINGVTTVVHHGGYHDLIKGLGYPVFLDYQYLHAIETEPYWKMKLNMPLLRDVMIHIGEGVGDKFHRDISKFTKWNFLNRNLIGIHAIKMDAQQSKKFKAVVWCPDSNLRLYNKTAPIDKLKFNTSILFGTDSSLSASSNLWKQLRLARSLKLLNDFEIYNSLIDEPAKIFKRQVSSSQIVAKKKDNIAWNSFFELEPEDLLLVSIQNKVMLADYAYFDFLNPNEYTLIKIGQSQKWIINKFASAVSNLESLGVPLPLTIRSK